MFIRIFIFDYFKNPFFWWGVFVLILTTFNASPVSIFILETIIVNQLYVPILYGLFVTLFFLAFYPIMKSISKLFHEYNLKTQALLYYGLISSSLFIHAVFFLPDAPFIFSKLQPQVITNYRVFDEAIQLKLLFDYLVIPLHFAFVATVVKKGLLKKELEIDEKIRNNFRLAIVTIVLFIFAYASHIIWQNYLQ